MSKIHGAILSVTDKTGLAEFARQLAQMNVELHSTGGTAKLLRDSGVEVRDISERVPSFEYQVGGIKGTVTLPETPQGSEDFAR